MGVSFGFERLRVKIQMKLIVESLMNAGYRLILRNDVTRFQFRFPRSDVLIRTQLKNPLSAIDNMYRYNRRTRHRTTEYKASPKGWYHVIRQRRYSLSPQPTVPRQ